MDSQTEQRLLATLYDRLFEIVTYTPQVSTGNAAPSLERSRTMIHLSKNQVVKADQFANAMSASNPEGNLSQAEAFSLMVDRIPLVQTEYRPRAGASVSKAYVSIVNGANSNLNPDPHELAMYNQADQYLNTFKETKDFQGNIRRTPVETEIFMQYKKLRKAFYTAVGNYRTKLASHNMNDPTEQQMWQAEAPALQGAIDDAYDTWRNADADLVEEALNVKASTMNNAVRQAIEDAQTRTSQPLDPGELGGQKWLLSYTIPDGWSSDELASSFSDFKLSSSNLNSSMSSEFTSYGGGGSWGAGLWSVGGGFDSSEASAHSHMDSDKFELHCKIGVIQVIRPWFDELLFSLSGWSMSGVAPGGISKGNLENVNDCILPLVPVSFVVARDIKITSNLSSADRDYLEQHFSTSASVGWGPFSISGHYSHTKTQESFQAHFEGGKLVVPGVQIIAWISTVLPSSPKA